MFSKQALLAALAVAGFAFGKPIARRLLANVPGFPGGDLGDNTAGAAASAAVFMLAKRIL